MSKVGAAAYAQRAAGGAVGDLAEAGSALAVALREDAVAAAGRSGFPNVPMGAVSIDARAALAPGGARPVADRLTALHDVAAEAGGYADVAADRSVSQLLGGVRDDVAVLHRGFEALDSGARTGRTPEVDHAVAAIQDVHGASDGTWQTSVSQAVGRALDTFPGRFAAAGAMATRPNRLDDVLVGRALLAEVQRSSEALADGSRFGAALAARQSINGSIELLQHTERAVLDGLDRAVTARPDGFDLDPAGLEAAAGGAWAMLQSTRTSLDDAARHAVAAEAPGLALEVDIARRHLDALASSHDRLRASAVRRLAAGQSSSYGANRLSPEGQRAFRGITGAVPDYHFLNESRPPAGTVSSERRGLRRVHTVDMSGPIRSTFNPLRRQLQHLREVADQFVPQPAAQSVERHAADAAIAGVGQRHGSIDELRAALAALTDPARPAAS